MTTKFLVCDPEKCTGCRICDFVCSAVKEKSFNPLLSRIRTVRIVPDENLAVTCRFCVDSKRPCVLSCPRKALSFDEETEKVVVDDDKCDGCGWCIEACDFGIIVLHPEEKVVKICDLCQGKPECILYCPKEALSLITMEQLSQRRRRKAIQSLQIKILSK